MVYYPKLLEFLDLAAISVTLCFLNYFIRERWTRQHNALPLFAAVLLLVAASAVCLLVSFAFYEDAPVPRKLPVMMWCLLFFIPPVIYYAYSVMDALAVRTIDRIGPFSARIEDPSEFAQARRMALRGDIDGAVQHYRRYQRNDASALFEAARLLKSVDRYIEAALLLEEITTRFSENLTIWAEASYQLAKLHEINLGESATALTLMRNLMHRAPMTRFGQLAAADIARLQALEDRTRDEEEETVAAAADPFYKSGLTGALTTAEAGQQANGPAPEGGPGAPAPPEASEETAG